MSFRTQATDPSLLAFYEKLRANQLAPLWEILREYVTPRPSPRGRSHIWRWREMRPIVEEAGERAPMGIGERRVLNFVSPGLESKWAATETLWAAYQYILPGEHAPTHRHSASAIRFIIEGAGAYTTVAGEKLRLHRNDFVVTPPWVWHAHGNDSDRPIVWMDGLDVPLVAELDAMFFEPLGERPEPPGKPQGDSAARFAAGGLRPAWGRPAGPASPLLIYRWEETRAALRRLAGVEESPFDGAAMAYVNPATGGPVLPTIGCWIQLLKPGARARAHRHTTSAVYCVAEGRGSSVIEGTRFDWEPGDIFTLHPWAWHEHAAGEGEAVLFSIHDTPVMEALGLYREEALGTNGGHQEVVGVFG